MEDLSFCLGEPWRLAADWGEAVSLCAFLRMAVGGWEGRLGSLLFFKHGECGVSGAPLLRCLLWLLGIGCMSRCEPSLGSRGRSRGIAPRLSRNGGEAWWGGWLPSFGGVTSMFAGSVPAH
jgi:hypothetical protein